MCYQAIGTEARNPSAIWNPLQQVTLNSVRNVLPDQAIQQACREAGYRYRRRVLTPVLTVLHMMLACIWPEESFAASWQLLWDWAVACLPGLAGKSPSSGSVAKARARLPLELWQALGRWVSAKAQALSGSVACWRGHRVVLADGTCVSMPDGAELMNAFGTSSRRGQPGRYPLARLLTLSLANTMTVLAHGLGGYRVDETTLLWPLLSTLNRGDLLVADRHFAAAHFYARYLAAGLEFLTPAHQRLKISRLRRIICYAGNDFVTQLRINPAYRRRDASLPRWVRLRMIQGVLRIRGKRQLVWFATSLLDAKAYPAAEIVAVYGRRWRIETLFRQVKVRLSADVLRSRTAEGVGKEVAARLVALNVIRCVMLEAALAHGLDPLQLSFAHATRAIVAFWPALAMQPVWKLPTTYAAMLAEIAAHRVPSRPGRLEPRAVRREVKHYPRLRTTRAEWRLAHAA